jgi:hypothetical protein
MNYKNLIGDGKTPNIYWVFQYDEKATSKNGDIDFPLKKANGGLIGTFKTYRKALDCANEAYLPHVIIEDRISGVVFETYCIVCSCCGYEKWESIDDIGFTKKTLGDEFI